MINTNSHSPKSEITREEKAEGNTSASASFSFDLEMEKREKMRWLSE